jgi:hypothetical protein
MGDLAGNEDGARAEFDGLRRRLDDHGGILRKHQQAVGELAESLGRMVTLQRRKERWVNANSFVAYILFTVVLGGAFLTLYRSRASELVAGRDVAVRERDVARNRVAVLEGELAARQQSVQKAYTLYQLLESGKRADAIARYGDLDSAQLTPTERDVLARGYKKAREETVDAGYLAGLDSVRSGDFSKAITELRRALAYEEEGPRAAQMRYHLGVENLSWRWPDGSSRPVASMRAIGSPPRLSCWATWPLHGPNTTDSPQLILRIHCRSPLGASR